MLSTANSQKRLSESFEILSNNHISPTSLLFDIFEKDTSFFLSYIIIWINVGVEE